MKRFVIFVLLGPVIGFIVFVLRDIAGGKIFGGFPGLLIGLPFAYLFGIVPALIMWLEDWWLCERIPLLAKVATSALNGYLAVIALLWLNTAPGQVHAPQFLTFGLVGAVPAAICSLLSWTGWSRKEQQV
ncbi:DUF5413 family protein [Rhodopseudomonas sp. P2A-2r]|uniref:DUF5413 family protein n=1 Tax=unclassified Rhodopseudomonas TaxID=2638247 RepID=UPI0022342F88|nr:DUF5413 family protein [Rhodopseudomonas sp. P2A-2r]UZE48751.1 DUF5413 family protein [Rhodopseudomonas sp. P2A-2r]